MIGQREGKRPRHSNSRPVRSTPLNAPIDHILTLIKDNPMLEWPRRMNGDPSKRSKHQILTLPPWTWTWHKGVLWSKTTNRDPRRPREVAANWSNPTRQKTNSPRKRLLLDDSHPYKRLDGRSYLTLRIPNAWRIFTLLAIKKKMRITNTAYPSKISPR